MTHHTVLYTTVPSEGIIVVHDREQLSWDPTRMKGRSLWKRKPKIPAQLSSAQLTQR